MTTSSANYAVCPECKQGPFSLLAGRFPEHMVKGLDCAGGGREPLEWPLSDTKARAEAVASLGTVWTTSVPSWSAHSEAPSTPPAPGVQDTPPGKKRKPRSNSKRAERKAEAAALDAAAAEVNAAGERRAKPKAKRSPRTYIVVAGRYETYASLSAACAALGGATATFEATDGINHDLSLPQPVLIVGRVLPTKYEPARTIPATVKVVR